MNKRVQTIPFAIDLLFLIAEAYPCLWFAMPVVKAILASLMIQLETGVDKTKRLKSDTKLLNDIDRWFLLVSKVRCNVVFIYIRLDNSLSLCQIICIF